LPFRDFAGKTSFVRVLSGLWAPGGGGVSAAQEEIAVVPQRVYSCIGSLQDQITYAFHSFTLSRVHVFTFSREHC
jgi:ABC-type uncharacterized transport system fused permease/ATPase subunit